MLATMLNGNNKVDNLEGIKTELEKLQIQKKIDDLELKEVDVITNLFIDHFGNKDSSNPDHEKVKVQT